MKANEIRKQKISDASWVGGENSSAELMHCAVFLREIAAQLAELKPRWVWLPIGDGLSAVFDVSKIRLVRPGNRPELTVIGNDWRDEQMIFAPIAEVCAKLGIPVEGE